MARLVAFLVLWLVLAGSACAATVSVAGLFPGKVLISIDGGAPRMLAVGQKTTDGITLVAAGADSATLDLGGQRRVLRVGESASMGATTGATSGASTSTTSRGPVASASGAREASDTIVLSADSAGHYVTVGAINGNAVKFFVDTGATYISMSAEVARRIGLEYRGGQQLQVATANGVKTAYAVKLASVRVGAITLEDVAGVVSEGPGTGDTVLLGMSFMSRLSMRRDGNNLRLSRRETDGGATDTRPQVTLTQNRGGMFSTAASVNGARVRFIVDTGATLVSIDTALARGIGLNYQNGQSGMAGTANGQVKAWRVRFDSISVGPITLYNIDGLVHEGPGLGVGLLGMSFLNRVEIKREGESLTLIKRF